MPVLDEFGNAVADKVSGKGIWERYNTKSDFISKGLGRIWQSNESQVCGLLQGDLQ